MSLHNEIMNIAHKRSRPLNNSAYDGCEFHGYTQGHRDARHAAAELSLKHEALIERLLDALEARHADDYVDAIRKEFSL